MKDRILSVVVILLVVAIVAGFFQSRQYYWGNPGNPYGQTIHNIKDCIDHWRPECTDLDFSRLNGIMKRDLEDRLPATALTAPRVVCEEDATAERCTRVRWGDQ